MLLRTNDVKKRYGINKVVEDINLEIARGKIYGLLGPNGCGKSTMMKIIAGLVRADEGTPVFNGEPIGVESKKKIAYMPTEGYFYSFMTGLSAAKYYEDFYDDFDMAMFLKIISDMNVKASQKVKSLSSGQMAKLKIALTMARNVDLYMLDEPLNGIDLIARDQVMKIILSRATGNNAIIISSHLVEELEPVLDEVYMIGNGIVLLGGDCDSIRAKEEMSVADIYRKIYGAGEVSYA